MIATHEPMTSADAAQAQGAPSRQGPGTGGPWPGARGNLGGQWRALLAVLARSLHGWDVTAALTAVGLMTACAAIGASIARLGRGKLSAVVLPMLAGSALNSIWLDATGALAILLSGGLR